MANVIAPVPREFPGRGWGRIPRPGGRSGNARRCRAVILAQVLILGTTGALAETVPHDWQILREPEENGSCRGGLGWSSEGEVISSHDCGLYIIEKPDGLGQRLNNYQGWYRYEVSSNAIEPELIAFIEAVCETVGFDEATARVTTTPQMKSLYFRCLPASGGELQ